MTLTIRTVRAALVPVTAMALLSALVAVAPAADAGTKNPRLPAATRNMVSGWMPYYTSDASLASFSANADLFADITGFWHSSTGATTITDQLSDTTRAAVVKAVHAKGVRVIGAVTDGTSAHTMAGILASTTKRTSHVNALVALAVANDYDGIDLDYEKFAFSDGSSTWAATRPSWVAFVKQLSTALHAKGLWLTVSVPVMYDSDRDGSSGYWVYDYAGIAPYVDRLRIMTYDFSTSSAGPIAPLVWVRRVLDYAVTQVPRAKIQLGVPAYGRDWPSSTTGCPVDNMPSRGTYTSRGALALAADVGATPTWDATTAERTFTYRKKYSGVDKGGAAVSCTVTRTVWFEEQSATAARAKLVGEYHLGGIAQWTIGGEDPAQWSRLRSYALSISKVSPRLELFAGDSVYGQPLRVRAVLTLADGTPVSGETWKLYWRPSTSAAWSLRLTGTTSSTGAMSVLRHPGTNGYWKLAVGGSWERYSATTDPNRTLVRLHVTGGFTRATVKVSSAASLKGQVLPAIAGLRVDRQRLVSGHWTTVGSTTTKANGAYAMSVTPTSRGDYTYRIKVSGSSKLSNGYSSRFHLGVS